MTEHKNMKKIAAKGATERFLLENVAYPSDTCLIWPYCRNAAGYGLAVINGRQSIASRLMCELAHGGPPTPKHESAHTCGKGRLGCVNPKHLRWATHIENMADTVTHGTTNRGQRSGKTKLTEENVIFIKNAPPNLSVLMNRFGVSKGCISKIRSGQRWWCIDMNKPEPAPQKASARK